MSGSIPTGSAVRLVDPAREVVAARPQVALPYAAPTPREGRASGADPARQVAGAVSEIRQFVQMVRRELQFDVDDQTGRTVVTVTDAETNEVIRQIPSEEVLRIAARLEEVNGVLFRGRA